MATKSRGAPYPLGSDPNDAAGWLDQLATWTNDRPGVAPLTTTQRNALTGVELWDGRLILNTTLDRIQRYDLGLVAWVTVADQSEIAALLATSGTPAQDGLTASRGVSAFAARADHVHPEALWANYTPTVGNITLGNGTRTGRWVRHGNTVHFWARLIFGTTTAITGGPQLGLPVAHSATGGATDVNARLTDSGSNYYYARGVIDPNATAAFLGYPVTNGGAAAITATAPFTWVAGDELSCHGTYEAA